MTPNWLAERRQTAEKIHQDLGWPTTGQEAFKYTNLKSLAGQQLAAPVEADTGLELADLGRPRLGFIDGKLVENNFPGQLEAGPLSGFLGALEGRLGALLGDEQHGLIARNTSAFENGLYLAATEATESPIKLHLAQGIQSGTVQPRHFITLAAGAQVDLVVTTRGQVQGTAHLNEVCEVFLGEGARLDLTWVHRGDDGLFVTSELAVNQGAKSQLNLNSYSLSSGLLRQGITIEQAGEGATVQVGGLAIAQDREHVDFHLDLQHRARDGHSEQRFRGLVSRGGRVVVSGKVTVAETGGGTEAHQSLRGILLSESAEWDARPQLEIYTEEVACSHGATVGSLDDEALFFLRSRGIGEEQGRRILAAAFAREVAESVQDPRISTLLKAAIDQGLDRLMSQSR